MRTKLELLNLYRTAWEAFVRASNTLQNSLVATAPDRALVEVSLFEAEKARLCYNAARDLLVEQMAGLRAAANPPSQNLPQEGNVRAVARLLWELDGQPDGTALADWLHAERLVRSASTAIDR